jgi:hypothetical protein
MIALVVLPVTLTPFEPRQLLKAARAELLIALPFGPPAMPDGAYLAQALNATEFWAPKDAPGRGDLVGRAPVGTAPGEKDPVGRAPGCPCPGVTFTPCCFRHVWNALSPADAVALLDAPPAAALPLLPPQPASSSAPASAGSAPRMRVSRIAILLLRIVVTVNRRNAVQQFM